MFSSFIRWATRHFTANARVYRQQTLMIMTMIFAVKWDLEVSVAVSRCLSQESLEGKTYPRPFLKKRLGPNPRRKKSTYLPGKKINSCPCMHKGEKNHPSSFPPRCLWRWNRRASRGTKAHAFLFELMGQKFKPRMGNLSEIGSIGGRRNPLEPLETRER